MNDTDRRTSELATRMRDFNLLPEVSFPANTIGGQKFAELADAVANIDQHSAKLALETGSVRQTIDAKKALRESIRRQMKVIRETAVSIEPQQPGISKSFLMPDSNSEESLIQAARAFIDAATPLKALFLSREMADNFLEKLAETVERFEECLSGSNLHRGSRSAAHVSFKDSLSKVIKLKRELNPIVRNKFRDDPAMLAKWETASHLERAPKKAAPAKPPVAKP